MNGSKPIYTMNLNLRRYTVPDLVRATISLALILFLTGCASVNHLREAQDAFNQAAATENSARFESNPADSAATLSSVRSGYASALLSLTKLDSKDQLTLHQDGLWGTVLTLKALCQWRLAQYSNALDSAEEARKNPDQLYPRDRALLSALPGLIKTDQAYAKSLITNSSLADIEALLVGPNGAVANIQSARELADKDHPVQVYLVQAQLAAYRNFTIALDRLNNHSVVPENHPAVANAALQLRELDRLLRLQIGNTSNQQLVNYWAKLCGLTPP